MEQLRSIPVVGKPENRTFVSVRTSYWSTPKGICSTMRINYLKRLSKGFNVLYEEVSITGAEEAFHKILNIGFVSDGIYEVVVCNEQKDWESGLVEDYDFKLVPVK